MQSICGQVFKLRVILRHYANHGIQWHSMAFLTRVSDPWSQWLLLCNRMQPKRNSFLGIISSFLRNDSPFGGIPVLLFEALLLFLKWLLKCNTNKTLERLYFSHSYSVVRVTGIVWDLAIAEVLDNGHQKGKDKTNGEDDQSHEDVVQSDGCIRQFLPIGTYITLSDWFIHSFIKDINLNIRYTLMS